MKLACVIHRFGDDIAGGSETHCRQVAEHLAAVHDVTILTTRARDHVTWRNAYPGGESRSGPLTVLRFSVDRQRSVGRFIDISDIVFSGRATPAEEEEWFRENGPVAPGLLEFLDRRGREFDRVLFWSYRYFNTFFGLPLAADRAVLVPTAEEDPAIHISLLADFFARPAGYLFLTSEEQQLIGARAPAATPSAVIGCGVDPPAAGGGGPSLDRLGVRDPFVLYLGRIDPNKGCGTLLQHFSRYAEHGGRAQLVMAGPANMPVPVRPWIRRLGFVDAVLRDELLARSRALVVPSPYESLSIVLIEAWNRRVPALVNARCRVLRGQMLRADGGLYYRTAAEFVAALDFLLEHQDVAAQFGQQGFEYVEREYRWPIVMEKVETLLERAGRAAAVINAKRPSLE